MRRPSVVSLMCLGCFVLGVVVDRFVLPLVLLRRVVTVVIDGSSSEGCELRQSSAIYRLGRQVGRSMKTVSSMGISTRGCMPYTAMAVIQRPLGSNTRAQRGSPVGE